MSARQGAVRPPRLSAALAVVLATAIVESVLVCGAAMLSCSKGDRVLDLIVQGVAICQLLPLRVSGDVFSIANTNSIWRDGSTASETKPSILFGLDDVRARSSVSVSS